MSLHNIPSWVRWLAQDADGAWWGYSVEPLQYDKGWYENEVGERIKLGQDTPNPHWHNRLRRHTNTTS
jgi:hypothetical protein